MSCELWLMVTTASTIAFAALWALSMMLHQVEGDRKQCGKQ